MQIPLIKIVVLDNEVWIVQLTLNRVVMVSCQGVVGLPPEQSGDVERNISLWVKGLNMRVTTNQISALKNNEMEQSKHRNVKQQWSAQNMLHVQSDCQTLLSPCQITYLYSAL